MTTHLHLKASTAVSWWEGFLPTHDLEALQSEPDSIAVYLETSPPTTLEDLIHELGWQGGEWTKTKNLIIFSMSLSKYELQHLESCVKDFGFSVQTNHNRVMLLRKQSL
jgi:hypothetical protein